MIDPRAEIHADAKIADDVVIGPWTIIGADVEIDSGTEIGSHAIIRGSTRIGKNNKIFEFTSIGGDPQDLKYDGEPTRLEIGDNNIIRENCTIHRGSTKGGGITRIGNHNFFMAYSHVAHDCFVGNHASFANYSALAGHVVLEDYASLAGYAACHQFCFVGAYSFIARGCIAVQDVLPYIVVSGSDASACGINKVGLKRAGFATETIENLNRAYKVIFRRGLKVDDAIVELTAMCKTCPEISLFIEALQRSERGIVR